MRGSGVFTMTLGENAEREEIIRDANWILNI